MSNPNQNNKSKTKFKDFILKELESSNYNQEGVIKNTSSANNLSMIRFLLNRRNQFTR